MSDELAAMVTVTLSTPCRACAYDLRGLPEDGTCPECGHSIADSLKGDWLWLSEPDWLRRVRSGASLQLLAILLVPLVTALWLWVVVDWLFRADALEWFHPVGQFMSLTYWLVFAFGVWRLTTPEGAARTRTECRVRRLARWSVLGGGLAGLVYVVTLAAWGGGRVLGYWHDSFVFVTVDAAAYGSEWIRVLLLSTALLACAVYVGRLAERIPARRTGRLATIGLGAGAMTVALVVLVQMLPLTGALIAWTPELFQSTYVNLSFARGVCFLLTSLYWFVVLCIFRRQLGKAIQQARRRVGGEPAATR